MAYYVAAWLTVFGIACLLDGAARFLGDGLADQTTRTGGDVRGTATILVGVGLGLLIAAVVSVIIGVGNRLDD